MIQIEKISSEKNSSSLRNADGRITGKKTILWYILKLLHDAL